MTLQGEATELEKKIVSLIEQIETNPPDNITPIKQYLIREYDYLRLVKNNFPNLTFPQYEGIKTYMEIKGWSDET